MTDLIEIKHERFIVDLLYNTPHHMLGRPLYSEFGLTKGFAHPDLYEKLLKTVEPLKSRELKLVVYDCYRPVAVQREMWNMLPNPLYVANPAEKGSNHNRATAVDCYLAHEDGTPLEFPTAPDGYLPGIEKDFERWMVYLEKAHHTYVCAPDEKHKCENREILRTIMEDAGFIGHNEEWWHYQLSNAGDYPLIELYTG